MFWLAVLANCLATLLFNYSHFLPFSSLLVHVNLVGFGLCLECACVVVVRCPLSAVCVVFLLLFLCDCAM
ncbi:hypothetical protein F5H01DRAFT_342309 [Linnemannia elongata]|nr:hypothetical protein F5H01DRAFT_342309 [Linnemannia elongata]